MGSKQNIAVKTGSALLLHITGLFVGFYQLSGFLF